MVLFFRDSNEKIYDSTILKQALFTHPCGQHRFVQHPLEGDSGAQALCCPAPFWEQPLGWHSPGGQSFHLSQSQERGLAYQGQRTNPFPVNFIAPSLHMFSSLDSHLPATLRAAHSVTAWMLSLWPKEVSIMPLLVYWCVLLQPDSMGRLGQPWPLVWLSSMNRSHVSSFLAP